jgi:hypothetical protein
MNTVRPALLGFGLSCLVATTAQAQVTPQMRDGIAGARYVPAYSVAQRAAALQTALSLSRLPVLGASVSVTPDAPYAGDGTHLSFWKTSFVLGTPAGGEAGVNFWGIHSEGHINVGFKSAGGRATAVDCRLLSDGPITYKIYAGAQGTPAGQGRSVPRDGHFLLIVGGPAGGGEISVEMWPTPRDRPLGFFGCELSVVMQ